MGFISAILRSMVLGVVSSKAVTVVVTVATSFDVLTD